MRKIFLLLGVVAIYTSCERDVIINIPKEPSKLVVNGLIGVNGTFRVTVGRSVYILENATGVTINNAQVALFENNIFKDSLVYNATNGTYNAKNNTRVTLGSNYLLKATAVGFNNVEAGTITPTTVPLQNISRKQNTRVIDGTNHDEVKFSFTDNVATEDYYIVRLRRPVTYFGATVEYQNIFCFKSADKDIDRRANTDPLAAEACIEGEFLMADKNFNGKQKEIVLYVNEYDMLQLVNPNNNRTFKPVIELLHITKEHYRYRKSYNTYRDAEDNPFAEPVLVFGNITNGYGIFSVFNSARDTIK
jgi:hypothetical protein